MTIRSKARACSTCSPAPARSASRRCRAAQRFTLFVDNGAEARALLRNNVEALGLGGVTKVYRRDATNLGPAHPVEPFSLVFLDPPYGKGLAEKALASLRDGGWLTPGALLVVEEAKAAAFAAPDGFEELERRAYDDTEFVFLRAGDRASTTTVIARLNAGDPVRRGLSVHTLPSLEYWVARFAPRDDR